MVTISGRNEPKVLKRARSIQNHFQSQQTISEISTTAEFTHIGDVCEVLAHVVVTDAVQHAAQLKSMLTREEWLEIHERVLLDYYATFTEQQREELEVLKPVEDKSTIVHMERDRCVLVRVVLV